MSLSLGYECVHLILGHKFNQKSLMIFFFIVNFPWVHRVTVFIQLCFVFLEQNLLFISQTLLLEGGSVGELERR